MDETPEKRPRGRPFKERPAPRTALQDAWKKKDPKALVEATIDTLVVSIDNASPSEVAALTKQLFDAMDRLKTVAPPQQGAVGEARAARADRHSGAVAAPRAARSGSKRAG